MTDEITNSGHQAEFKDEEEEEEEKIEASTSDESTSMMVKSEPISIPETTEESKSFQCNRLSEIERRETVETQDNYFVHMVSHMELRRREECTRDEGSFHDHRSRHVRKEKFECNRCDFKTKTKFSLKRHKKRKHGTYDHLEPKKCEFCPYSSRNPHNYKAHVLQHPAGKEVECDVCGFKTKTRFSLARHKRRNNCSLPSSRGRIKKCEKCSYSTRYADVFTKHALTHVAEKNFKCDRCDVKVKTQKYLKRHKRDKHGDEVGPIPNPVPCEICGESFFNLEKHMGVHGGCHECPTCKKTFSTKRKLIAHKRSHNFYRKHLCTECGRRFKTATSLKGHKMAVHSDEKPFSCNDCEYRCAQFAALKQHVIRNHTKEKSFVCETCGAGFFVKGNLMRHMAIHAEDPKEFREEFVKDKMIVCHICGKSYRDCIFKRHLVVHSKEKKFQCEVCLKSFTQRCSLNTHLVVHTGEKPFKCDRCDKSYSQKYPLTLHKRKDHA